MGSGKAEKKKKTIRATLTDTKLSSNSKLISKTKKKRKDNDKTISDISENQNNPVKNEVVPVTSASQQLCFFLNAFESANGVSLSSLERESITDKCFVELSQNFDKDVKSLGKHIKAAYGPSWKEDLYEGQIVEGKIDPGNPAVLVLSSSALRAIELLRGLHSLTRECNAVKLFSKHMKVEEQIALLKQRVNFGSGTPSRVKKLIDIEALGLSHLRMIVLDMHPDVKGYTLMTLPQVRDEFWDLYNNYFHQRLLQGDLRICLFGPLPDGKQFKGKKKRSPG
ncbi:hypothetical protein K2173_011621 [Erythroxylum novogranatense]|uniref:Protein CMSS1 n=1 Tax=Erythroxylum novogranatense TaxID=1862640 RepID=A0AAV8U4X9_9ROSI|nr:hypothetical protein K2173_011621 [Erythroxylum novogranatense]